EVTRLRVDAEQGAGEAVVLALVLDVGMVEDPIEAVEPAIGAPGQRVGQFVRVGASEAGNDDFGFARGLAVGTDLVEEDVGRVGDPDAAVADGNARGNVEALGEHGDLVDLAVAVGVFEDLDAIAAGPGGATRVFEALGDPDAAALVEGHRYWI